MTTRLNETRFGPKKSRPCPDISRHFLMDWMSVKLPDNFQIREHSRPSLFHIKTGNASEYPRLLSYNVLGICFVFLLLSININTPDKVVFFLRVWVHLTWLVSSLCNRKLFFFLSFHILSFYCIWCKNNHQERLP